MRAITLIILVFFTLLAGGCGDKPPAQAEARPDPIRQGNMSLYPLSMAEPVRPLENYATRPADFAPSYTPTYAQSYTQPYGQTQTSVPVGYTDPAGYSGYATAAGGYCEVTPTSPYMPTTLVVPDPPVIVNEGGRSQFYASSPYQSTPYSAPYSTVPVGTTYSSETSYAPTSYAPTTVTTATTYDAGTYTTTTTSYTPPTASYVAVPTSTVSTYSSGTTYPAVSTTYPISTPMATPSYSPAVYQAPPATYYSPSPLSVPASPLPVSYGQPLPAADFASAGVTTMQLVPAPDVPPGNHPSDYGPSQWFEILRPGNGPMRIGRVSSTCVCVGVRVPKRFVAAGERALIEARTMTKPPYSTVTYGIYVNVIEPQKTVLDVDVTVSRNRGR